MKDLIKEQRFIEATRKHLIGPDGKIGTIVRNLGCPIRSQNSLYQDVAYLDPVDDFYNTENESLPEMDEDETVTTLGLVFDGLSRGMHIEIRYFEHSLTVTWKGYKVFEEEKGDLLCFVPHPDWEGAIDRLYKLSRKMDIEARKEKKKQEDAIVNARKQSWLREMMTRWGFNLQ